MPDLPALPLVAAAFDYPGGHLVAPHRHGSGQFLYATHGILKVAAGGGSWALSPRTALWVPAGVTHEVRTVGPVAMRTAYVRRHAFDGLPSGCCLLEVSTLLRELICRAIALSAAGRPPASGARLVRVLEDEIRAAPFASLPLLMPADARARRVADALLADPADDRTLEQWSLPATASARTLERIFHGETGLSFGGWRARLRLLRALDLLARGRGIKSIALTVGYRSPGAFIAMFRRAMGVPPAAWQTRQEGLAAQRARDRSITSADTGRHPAGRPQAKGHTPTRPRISCSARGRGIRRHFTPPSLTDGS